MAKNQFGLMCIVALSVVACSESSDRWVPADIDTSTTVENLGTAGYGRVCSAFADYVRDMYRSDKLVQAACIARALETTGDAASCGDYVARCVDAIPPEVEALIAKALASASCTTLDIDPTACGVSVSTLTSCLDALGTQFDRAQYGLSCAAFGSPVPSDWYEVALPASCSRLISQC